MKAALFCGFILGLSTLVLGQEPAASLPTRLLAAARAGQPAVVSSLVQESQKRSGSLDKEIAKELLDGLARSGETAPFTLLLDELRQTHYGTDWQPDDALLTELVAQGSPALLDALLARELDLERLTKAAQREDLPHAEWIATRVAQVGQERAALKELVSACGKGDLGTMRRLLEVGVDVNGTAGDGWTPLTKAANKNQPAAVRLLLEYGAVADKVRYPGWDYTPLCLTRSVEVADLLKAYGANVQAKLFGRSVSILTYMARYGGGPIVEWMLKEGVDPKQIGDNQQTLLFDAGDGRTVELLLAAGLDPNHVDEFGKTPLAAAQSAEGARRLIAAGAKLDEPDLLAKCLQGFAKPEALEEILKAIGEPTRAALQMALIAAAHLDEEGIVKILLQHGAQVNEPGQWGSSSDNKMLPLSVCAVFGSEKSAKVLLEAGANPNAGEKPGEFLQTAVANGHREVAKLLHQAGATGLSDLALALAIDDKVKTGELLQAAPTFVEKPEFWAGVLETAAQRGQVEVVQQALAKGVPMATPSGDNALQAAAGEGQHEVLALLLARPKEELSPGGLNQALWWAVWNAHPYEKQRPAEAFVKTVELLLGAGALPSGEVERKNLLRAVIFTRNPGGSPAVLEMLVHAGLEPDPEFPVANGAAPQRLSALIESSCAQQGCSVPMAATLRKFESLARVTIKR